MTAKGIGGKFCRTVLVEPMVYGESRDDRRSRGRYHVLAEQAWCQFVKSQGNNTLPTDFACGFKEGYSDYLYAGGNGAPPPVPPRRYWNEKWRTPEGNAAVECWYAGFRNGVAVAMSQGRRECEVVPTSLNAECGAVQPLPLDDFMPAMAPEPPPQ